MQRRLVITGPTGVGKTAYVNALMEVLPLEVINMDSIQVYAFFAVGPGRSDGDHPGRRHLYGYLSPHSSLDPALLCATAVAPLAAFATSDAMVAYFGMSSTVHGAAAAAVVHEWRSARGRPPPWIVALSLILPACLLLELFTGPLVFHLDLGRHVRSVPLTHLAGFAAGAVCMIQSSPGLRLRRGYLVL